MLHKLLAFCGLAAVFAGLVYWLDRRASRRSYRSRTESRAAAGSVAALLVSFGAVRMIPFWFSQDPWLFVEGMARGVLCLGISTMVHVLMLRIPPRL